MFKFRHNGCMVIVFRWKVSWKKVCPKSMHQIIMTNTGQNTSKLSPDMTNTGQTDMHSFSVYHVCHDVSAIVIVGKHWKSVRYLITLSQQMFNCYQTRRWWQFCFQQDSATRSVTACERTLNFTSFNYCLQHKSPAKKPTDYTIWVFAHYQVSYSISCKSTRLKKSSSDWLKSYELGYSIEWKDAILCFFLFRKVVQRHYLGQVGK